MIGFAKIDKEALKLWADNEKESITKAEEKRSACWYDSLWSSYFYLRQDVFKDAKPLIKIRRSSFSGSLDDRSQEFMALIDNLERFILELGRGFAFVERQQHIVTDTDDFYIDLVFYNFKIKRFVIFELKTHRLTHQDIGQLDMYVRMYDDLLKGDDDQPTIGVLLCTDTDNTIARYSVLHDSDQLYAAKYMTFMPTEEELRREIEQQKQFFLMKNEKKEEKV